MAKVRSITGTTVVPLREGWEVASTGSGSRPARPRTCRASSRGSPAQVPGTVAERARSCRQVVAGRSCAPAQPRPLVPCIASMAAAAKRCAFDGLATLAEVWLNGRRVLSSDNMFTSHEVDADVDGDNEIFICFRALIASLAKGGSAGRWRPRMITPSSLRNVRPTVLGSHAGLVSVRPCGRPVARCRAGPARRRICRLCRCARFARRRHRRVQRQPHSRPRRRSTEADAVLRRTFHVAMTTADGKAFDRHARRCRTSPPGGRTRTARRRCTMSASRIGAIDHQSRQNRLPQHRSRSRRRRPRLRPHDQWPTRLLPRRRVGVGRHHGASRPAPPRSGPWLELAPRSRHEHAARAGNDDLRGPELLRAVRRARHPRLAGLHVRQLRLSR